MELRESAQCEGSPIELDAVFDSHAKSGIEHGAELLELSSAVLGGDTKELGRARAAVAAKFGDAGVSAVVVTAGAFSLVDRAANGVGLPTERVALEMSEEFRGRLGVNAFRSARNSGV